MTISSSTDSQINPVARSQSQNAGAKNSAKNSADTPAPASEEKPAVVVETSNQPAKAAEATGAAAIETRDDALSAAEAIGAALREQESSIANGSSGQVSSLLSEFEAAYA